MESQAKLKEKYMSFVHWISSFEGPSYTRIQDTASVPVPLFLVLLHHTRIYISRYHFSSSINKVIRSVLNFFFYDKISQVQKSTKSTKKH